MRIVAECVILLPRDPAQALTPERLRTLLDGATDATQAAVRHAQREFQLMFICRHRNVFCSRGNLVCTTAVMSCDDTGATPLHTLAAAIAQRDELTLAQPADDDDGDDDDGGGDLAVAKLILILMADGDDRRSRMHHA